MYVISGPEYISKEVCCFLQVLIHVLSGDGEDTRVLLGYGSLGVLLLYLVLSPLLTLIHHLSLPSSS